MRDWQHPVAVEVIFPYKLRVTFEDGSVKIVDCAGELHGPVFVPLNDPLYFARAFVDEDLETVAWPNGADLAPEFLWENGVEVTSAPWRHAPSLPSAEVFADDVPGLRTFWRECEASAEFEADVPYVQMGWVGTYIANRVIESRDAELGPFVERVERLCDEANQETRDLIATGLLESIQNTWLRAGRDLADFPVRFGPRTTRLWDALIAIWQGKMSPARFNRLIREGE